MLRSSMPRVTGNGAPCELASETLGTARAQTVARTISMLLSRRLECLPLLNRRIELNSPRAIPPRPGMGTNRVVHALGVGGEHGPEVFRDLNAGSERTPTIESSG